MKFTEWTDDGKLRHPVYLGLRDDKSAKEVVMEKAGAANRCHAVTTTTAGAGCRRRTCANQLQALEDARRDGDLALPNGDRVRVTNLSEAVLARV